MAIQALNLSLTKSITHPDDTENPTKFEIGVIDSRVLGMLQDRATSITIDPDNPDAETGVQMAQNEVAFVVAQFGVKGFSNFMDDEGEVSFETERKVVGGKAYEVLKASILATIPSDVIKWLADEVQKLNALSAKEGKK